MKLSCLNHVHDAMNMNYYSLVSQIQFDHFLSFKTMYYEHKTIYKLFRDDNETKDISFDEAIPHLNKYFPDLDTNKDPRGQVDVYGWYKYTWFTIVNDKYPKYQREDLVKCMKLIKAISYKIEYDHIRDYLLCKQ